MMRAKLWRSAGLALGAVALVTMVAARGENLDQGKSGPRLFADTCAACHHSARGLTKGRFRVTLYLFLQKHYASNGTSAWELASYLEDVDDSARGHKGKARAGAPKQAAAAPARSNANSSFRPPAPIPQR